MPIESYGKRNARHTDFFANSCTHATCPHAHAIDKNRMNPLAFVQLRRIDIRNQKWPTNLLIHFRTIFRHASMITWRWWSSWCKMVPTSTNKITKAGHHCTQQLRVGKYMLNNTVISRSKTHDPIVGFVPFHSQIR